MKSRLLWISWVCFLFQPCFSQETPEHELENIAAAEEGIQEDDSYWQQLEYIKKHPLNINTASESELKEIVLLGDIQIKSLLSYRRLAGPLISIYELQAIPYWEPVLIRKILPYITISSSRDGRIADRLNKGDHHLLLRISQTLGKDADQLKYKGSSQRIFLRYRYAYKNILQYGIAADKDAGEQFLKGAQRAGFDFYSVHFFAKNLHVVKALAVGDFTVNMGHGLIHWQSMAFKKSAATMNIKRQSPVLRPYNSGGEFYFHRGLGITIKRKNTEASFFISRRKLNANTSTDSIRNKTYFTSFLVSGYNRTASEINDRHSITQQAAGFVWSYSKIKWKVNVNSIYYHFSLPLHKKNEPYNLYAFNGQSWYNLSADYSYTYKNFHFFGETATGKGWSRASIHGLMISADPAADISFVYRSINPAYQAVYANVFSESSSLSGETGLYTGISIRPLTGWQFNAYADLFRFPWLRSNADAPSKGIDLLAQLNYSPHKRAAITLRYRNETKELNDKEASVIHAIKNVTKQSCRIQADYHISPGLMSKNRVELVWYNSPGNKTENGFLLFSDIIYKPLMKKYSGVFRLQLFETGGYDSRIYAYENDVLYSYSVPSFSGKGFRYYVLLNYDHNQKISVWCRMSSTINNKDVNENPGHSECKIQIKYSF